MRNLLTLLLLAAFGTGLVAGPHPCAPEPGKRLSLQASCHRAMSQPASCHEPASSRVLPATGHRSDDSQSPQNCCDLLCQHACQSVALAGARAALLVNVPISGEAAVKTARAFVRFASAIDHIPLA